MPPPTPRHTRLSLQASYRWGSQCVCVWEGGGGVVRRDVRVAGADASSKRAKAYLQIRRHGRTRVPRRGGPRQANSHLGGGGSGRRGSAAASRRLRCHRRCLHFGWPRRPCPRVPSGPSGSCPSGPGPAPRLAFHRPRRGGVPRHGPRGRRELLQAAAKRQAARGVRQRHAPQRLVQQLQGHGQGPPNPCRSLRGVWEKVMCVEGGSGDGDGGVGAPHATYAHARTICVGRPGGRTCGPPTWSQARVSNLAARPSCRVARACSNRASGVRRARRTNAVAAASAGGAGAGAMTMEGGSRGPLGSSSGRNAASD